MFVLGPALDNVFEPMPGLVPPPTPGRRTISFDVPPTAPGGNVFIVLNAAVAPADIMPTSIYAFFVQPVDSVPVLASRTPDWFFKSSAPSGSVHAGTLNPRGTITVPGVKPSLDPYFVQTILEFPD